ncbi:hypothetical protein Tco_0109647 [Tanacetum coccineum]
MEGRNTSHLGCFSSKLAAGGLPLFPSLDICHFLDIDDDDFVILCVLYVFGVGYVILDNQSIERDRLNGIGFVLNFVKVISFTFGDKEMILVIEAIVRDICEVFVDLELAIRQDLGFIPSGNVVLSSTYVGKILGADQLLVILCYRYQESGIGYWILSMTISGSGVTFLPSELNGAKIERSG